MKKNIIFKYIYFVCLLFAFVACEDNNDVENKVVDKPKDRTEAYLEALRAYKESDHEVSFGWFGGWNADQATMGSRLTSAPDSIDIISIWGKYWDITPAQKADLRYVQENYGTKVTYTILPMKYQNLLNLLLKELLIMQKPWPIQCINIIMMVLI